MDNPFLSRIRDHLPNRIAAQWQTIIAGQWQDVARLWDVKTGAEIGAFHGCADDEDFLNRSPKVLFSPDSKTLAISQEDGTIRLWDVPPGSRIWQILGSASILWLAYVGAMAGKKSRRGEAKAAKVTVRNQCHSGGASWWRFQKE
jgi:WD40 repeat protein